MLESALIQTGSLYKRTSTTFSVQSAAAALATTRFTATTTVAAATTTALQQRQQLTPLGDSELNTS